MKNKVIKIKSSSVELKRLSGRIYCIDNVADG